MGEETMIEVEEAGVPEGDEIGPAGLDVAGGVTTVEKLLDPIGYECGVSEDDVVDPAGLDVAGGVITVEKLLDPDRDEAGGVLVVEQEVVSPPVLLVGVVSITVEELTGTEYDGTEELSTGVVEPIGDETGVLVVEQLEVVCPTGLLTGGVERTGME